MLREIRLRFEDEVAAYELKLIELSRWEKRWDEYNDVHMWVNTETDESSYEALFIFSLFGRRRPSR